MSEQLERIQNLNLYQQYAVRKMHMDAANAATSVVNEHLLWHGTSAETVQHINNDGFNRSYCGKNGNVKEFIEPTPSFWPVQPDDSASLCTCKK